jgi:hypothetical protein
MENNNYTQENHHAVNRNDRHSIGYGNAIGSRQSIMSQAGEADSGRSAGSTEQLVAQ